MDTQFTKRLVITDEGIPYSRQSTDYIVRHLIVVNGALLVCESYVSLTCLGQMWW